MPLRITGMNSGLDTESIITELVKAKKTKVDKEKKAQTKLQWKQDAWKELNTKLLNLYQKTCGNLRFSTAYMKKTTSASNANAVKVITGENAVNGVQTMNVDYLAKTGYLTGAALGSGQDGYTADTKLSEIKKADGTLAFSGSGSFSITVEGKTTDVQINDDTTISSVVSSLKAAGVNANFDEKNQRFFISSKKSGAENDFTITANDTGGDSAMAALGIQTSLADDTASLEQYRKYAAYYVAGNRAITIANMQSLIDSTVAERAAAYKKDYDANAETLTKTQERLDLLKQSEDYKNAGGQKSEDLKTAMDAKQEEIKEIQESMSGLSGADLEAKEAELKAAQEEVTNLSKQYATVKEVEDAEKSIADLNGKQTENLKYIDADGSATAQLTSEVSDSYYAKAENAAKVMEAYNNGTLAAGSAKRIAGTDAQITLNGATFTSDTNTFEINGLTITAQAVTTEEFNLTTQDDTDGIYDTIKNFLKEYNSIINEMDKLYNAESVKGYEPLTDDEKDEMSDKEIEKWEEKIKGSILRRDETVNSVASSLKSVMSAGVDVDGVHMNLSDFGINTLSYFLSADNEKNAYHIDGDPDDSSTSANADKLKAMIASDPEKVTKFFSGLTNNLYQKMAELSSRQPGYRSYNSFYYDQRMKEDYADYTKKIADLEKKLTAYEDKWYNKFSAMETALARLQSNESAISGLLGGL